MKVTNEFINKTTDCVIPAKVGHHVGYPTVAGIQRIKNWIPGQARNDLV